MATEYRPIHKRTGQEYQLISQKELESGEWSREPYRSHFRFDPVEIASATPPKEAKKAHEAKTEKEEGQSPA